MGILKVNEIVAAALRNDNKYSDVNPDSCEKLEFPQTSKGELEVLISANTQRHEIGCVLLEQ